MVALAALVVLEVYNPLNLMDMVQVALAVQVALEEYLALVV
jgi:hypothetical protein